MSLQDDLRGNATAHFNGYPMARRITGQQLTQSADALDAAQATIADLRAQLEAADELARRVDEQQNGVPMVRTYVPNGLAAYREARKSALANYTKPS